MICGLTRVPSAGEVIKHGEMKVIMSEGMPRHKHPDERGDLVINFKVLFPDQIPVANLKKLYALLPGKVQVEEPMDADVCDLIDIPPEQIHGARGRDDDEHGGRGPHVQCAQQ